MLFTVHHNTTYSYSQPVALGPHMLRLRPRTDGSQRLLDFQLTIEPKPSLLSQCLDLEGNGVIHAWFSGTTTRLPIAGTFTLETLRRNPFDYRLEAGFNRLPVTYDATLESHQGRPKR